jgi:hypothetical protein
VVARVAQAPTEISGRSTDATPSRSPARGILAPRPERRSARQTQAATIVEELRGAGVDLSDVRSNISASMRRDPASFSMAALRVLHIHFPNLSSVGFDARDPLVAALRDRLRQETSGSRRGLFSRIWRGGPSRSPTGGAATPQPARQPEHETQAALIVDEFLSAGLELPTIRAHLSTLMHRRELHMDQSTVSILKRHMPDVFNGAFTASDPRLLALDAALQDAASGGRILAAFGSLRTISKADAERLGFKDAATHSADEATFCMFGEPLSLADPNQRIIGLAPVPSDPKQAYSAEVNKEPEFMDLTALAKYLSDKPQHPLNKQPLDARTIHQYAFRIE